MFGDDAIDLLLRPVLPPRERIKFRLCNNHLLVRPTHGDKLTDERHLEFALDLLAALFCRVFMEPARERVNQREVTVHVLVFDERATHDDLRNQNKRDDIGGGFRIGHQR